MDVATPIADAALALPQEARAFARLADYFGAWAIHEETFLRAWQYLRQLDLAAHIRARQTVVAVAGDLHVHAGVVPQSVVAGGEWNSKFGFLVSGGVAILELAGSLMKHASSFDTATSTVRARYALREAVRNPEIQAILLAIDSPGGTVAGTQDLAADVAAAARKKPVHAYAEDLCASAAYWVASQALHLSAGPTSLIGSIGTYGVVVDSSAWAAKEGVQVHVVRAGQHKGAGVPGTPVTPEQLAECQRLIDGLNAHFLAGVAAGRKLDLSRVEVLADGRLHLAAEARKLGLIDAVESFDDALARLRQRVSSNPPGARAMSQPQTTPTSTAEPAASAPPPASPAAAPAVQAATIAQLRAACPGASDSFLLAQLEAHATVAAAQTAFIVEQQRLLAAAQQPQSQAARPRPGVQERVPELSANGVAPVAAGDVVAQVEAAVQERMQTRREPRHVAFAAVMREDADRRAAYNVARAATSGGR